MKLQTTVSALAVTTALAAAGLSIAPGVASAGSADVSARPGAPGKPKIVKVTSNDKKVSVSDARFRPGVTEFRVPKTAHRNTSIIVFETDNISRLFKKFGEAAGGGAGSADAMKTVDRIATFYGGGGEGSRWQVKLSKGSYYVAGDNDNFTTIKVSGDRRGANMAKPDSEIWTTKENQFETSGPLAGKWVSFTNHSREIHFLAGDHVAGGTTAKDVRQGLKSPKQPNWIRKGGFHFDIQSPGIKTVHMQDVKSYRYLLLCWMPSEEQDGVPHAMMGMWHLVEGK
ncbi:MAG: hypothetical protein LH645_05785 [Actinomycetia bacterium]|nr:hypothetical protein [Actinomycetes bacterium]